MTLPQNVKDAVNALEELVHDEYDGTFMVGEKLAYISTIHTHLLSQESEIDRLRNWNERVSVCRDHTAGIVDGECLVCRLAAANALLRDVRDSYSTHPVLHARIQTHLQGAGDEAV